MKVLLYGINFSPELTGIGKYTGEMAAWLAARGHAVRVVTAPPYYPEWKLAKGYRNWWSVESHDVVSNASGTLAVYRCPLWVPMRPGGLTRLLHLVSFALSSLPVIWRHIFWRPDVVWVVEPALLCTPAAVTLAKLSGAKAWLHVQDFEVDAAFALGLLRAAYLQKTVAGAERWLMRRFDVVSTISSRMRHRLLEKGVPLGRAVLTPNWVDVSATLKGDLRRHAQLGAMACHHDFRAELGIVSDTVVALYSGNMGAKQGLELLADVASICRDWSPQGVRLDQTLEVPPAILFVFCGDGVGRAELVRRCDGLSNVRFLNLQPVERLSALLAMADIHLLPQRADAADLVMPSKLAGMMASGRPVVATARAGTELASVIAGDVDGADAGEGTNAKPKTQCGLVVEPGNARAFAQAVQLLAKDAELRVHLGHAGHHYALAHMDRDAILLQFESRLMAVVDPRAAGAGFIGKRLAWGLLSLQILTLFVGTLMPGAWRSAVEQSVHAGFGLSSWAHFVLFASMAWLQTVSPLRWPLRRVLLVALALGLVTEGLQFFAIDRHPRLIDIGIDLAGVFAGVGLASRRRL
jgi:colanic acid biosynthesis glycosyl transferase WcaI